MTVFHGAMTLCIPAGMGYRPQMLLDENISKSATSPRELVLTRRLRVLYKKSENLASVLF